MNYFELIQDIARIKLGEVPSLFSEVSSDDYYKINEEIENAVNDFFFSSEFDFRKNKTTLSTVADQEAYAHNYGIIKSIQLTNDNDAIKYLLWNPDYEDINLRNNNSETGEPSQFTIYGGELKLYPIPDDEYTLTIFYLNDNPIKYVGSIDQSSAAAQANVYITETEGFTVGNTVTIEPNTPREETGTILSVTEDDYITLTSNLTYTHASGSVEYYKNSFSYENDAPNFPEKFHKIIIYKTLMELYYGDPNRYQKYQRQYNKKYKQMFPEARGIKRNVNIRIR